MNLKAVFLDKDGTLVKDVPYNVDPARIELMPGAAQGLRMLQNAGYRLIIVSNQSGVARGYFAEQALVPVEERLRGLLGDAGVSLDGFYYCPHHPQGSVAQYTLSCLCRKPAPGLLLQAAQELDLTLHSSWMIGDILDDVEAGRRAGCRTILLDNGNETEWVLSPLRQPDHIAREFIQAAYIILDQDRLLEDKRDGTKNFAGWEFSRHD